MVGKNDQLVIETFSLTKVFPDWWGRSKVIAVDNLDLKVKKNEIYGFLGPNGSGKTTTLKMLLNLLHPTKGRSLILGGVSSDPEISARLGYLPEDSYLYKYLSARETLDFYGRLFNLPAKVRKARIDTLLEMVGLAGMANRAVGTFSKGMARRIGLAQALINDPELLILDEPTSGMDPIGTRQIKDLLIHLAKRGKTILLCSHLLADVEDVCDRIGILYGGRMQVEGTVKSLLRHTDQKQILTGAISDEALDKIKQIVQQEDADFEVSSPMDKLEKFFVRTVANAQKKDMPTSGAVSSTTITGFLAEKDQTADVLDRLVSAPVDDQPLPDTTLQSVTREPQTESQSLGVDDNLLGRLTQKTPEASDSDDSQPPVQTTEATESVEPTADEIRKDLLGDLTRRKIDADGSTEISDGNQVGDDQNA